MGASFMTRRVEGVGGSGWGSGSGMGSEEVASSSSPWLSGIDWGLMIPIDVFCCTWRAARRFGVSGTCRVVRRVEGEPVGVALVVLAGGVDGRVSSVSVTTIAGLFSLTALIPRRDSWGRFW